MTDNNEHQAKPEYENQRIATVEKILQVAQAGALAIISFFLTNLYDRFDRLEQNVYLHERDGHPNSVLNLLERLESRQEEMSDDMDDIRLRYVELVREFSEK